MFDRVLKVSWVVNMPGFWICQGHEYTMVLNMSELLNMNMVLNYSWILFKCVVTFGGGGVGVVNLDILKTSFAEVSG